MLQSAKILAATSVSLPQECRILFSTTLSATLGLTVALGSALAETRYAACQPPAPKEYLLLVISQGPDSQSQLQRTLPPNISSTICNYRDDVVTRIGGFSSLETANTWAKYLSEIGGLTAYVARPPEISTPQTVAAQPPRSSLASPPQNTIAFKPKPLGKGYAVLVDYRNQPEIATQIRRITGRDVGLASYGQRPYLLANYTPNQGTANATLKTLSDRGFLALLVDSQKVVLLRSVIDK